MTTFIMPRVDPQLALYHPHQMPHSQFQGSQLQLQLQSGPQVYQPSSQQISPPFATSISPTSPKSCFRDKRRPLYTPAVLRQNEHSSRKAPAKKPESEEDDGLKTNSSFISLSKLNALSLLSRRSTGDSAKCVDGEWDLDLFPIPSAQPTRKHWKPDTESVVCDEPSCLRHFNYWTRRHHCRRCGNIFCDPHSAFDIPLDQDANYNPKGTISRACKHCYLEFKTWRSRTNSQASTEDEYVTRGSQSAPSSPAVAISNGLAGKPRPSYAEVAASVPRDWNWSTF